MLLPRLDAVAARLDALAATDAERVRNRLTLLVLLPLAAAIAGCGEQWEWGEVWAPLAEFVPYWLAQAVSVIAAYRGEPVPFGRAKSDAQRVAAIARDRTVAVLMSGKSDPVITKKPEGAWTHAVYEAMK